FDIKGAACRKKFHSPGRLGWALNIFAAPGDELWIASHGAATDRAFAVNVSEEIERLCVAQLRFHHRDHCWDYFTGLLDHNCVADPDVFALDFVLVVQCCAANSTSANEHRLEHSDWRQNPRATNLNDDIEQTRFHALRFVF